MLLKLLYSEIHVPVAYHVSTKYFKGKLWKTYFHCLFREMCSKYSPIYNGCSITMSNRGIKCPCVSILLRDVPTSIERVHISLGLHAPHISVSKKPFRVFQEKRALPISTVQYLLRSSSSLSLYLHVSSFSLSVSYHRCQQGSLSPPCSVFLRVSYSRRQIFNNLNSIWCIAHPVLWQGDFLSPNLLLRRRTPLLHPS